MGGEGAPPSLEGDVPEDCPLFVDPVLLFLKVDTMVAGEQVVEGGTAGLEVTVTEGLAKTLASWPVRRWAYLLSSNDCNSWLRICTVF